MRAVLPVALILVLVGRLLADETAADLASQLLCRLASEEAAAPAPADSDAAIADLALLTRKYPYDRNSSTWPAWEGCARGITGLLAFTNEVRAVLAAEQDGQRREGLDRLAALFRREEAPLVS